MNLDQLEVVCQEAARGLHREHGRPLPAAVVLPLPHATRVLALEGFPDGDAARAALLGQLARDEMRPREAPAYGFVAEAEVPGFDGGAVDVVVVAYGAHRLVPRVTAAPLSDEGIGPFQAAEELLPGALPFLAPLQEAADAAQPAPPAPPA